MANVDFPRGFLPYGPVLRCTEYPKASGTVIYDGDIVTKGSAGEVVVSGTGTTWDLGVSAEYVPSGAGKVTVRVYDHPDQEFVAQDDGDTTQLLMADLGANADIVYTTGDTTKKTSKHEIDSSTAGVGTGKVALPLRIKKLYSQSDNVVATATGDTDGANARWVVVLNNHQLAQTQAT